MKYVACVLVAIGAFLVASIIINSEDVTKVGMSWTEFRTQWAKNCQPTIPVSEAMVNRIFGKPDKFQSAGSVIGSYYYYYRCNDGVVQVEVLRLYEQYLDDPDYRGKIKSVGLPRLI